MSTCTTKSQALTDRINRDLATEDEIAEVAS